MAIGEYEPAVGEVLPPGKHGKLISVDFRTGEIKPPHKRYSHAELVDAFGPDYRLIAAQLFLESGDILSLDELEWLDIGDDRREHKGKDPDHPGSDADYLVWMFSKRSKNILAVSVLPPHSETRGYHAHYKDPHKMIETYRADFGNPTLWRKLRAFQRDFDMEEGQTIPIYPGQEHMVQNSTKSPVMLSIIIGNGQLYPEDKLHINTGSIRNYLK